MADRTDLLVIGAGPYAYSAAACARDNGIDTRVVGLPDELLARADAGRHVPALRAATGTSTPPASTPSRPTSRTAGCAAPTTTRSRSAVFLDHTDWFREQKGFDVDERLVDTPEPSRDGGFVADDGGRHDDHRREGAGRARHPALRHTCPAWYDDVPARPARAHQRPGRLRRPRRRPGGRSSAAGRAPTSGRRCSATTAPRAVDVVHRHPTPAFDRVSWAFVNPYVEQTLAQRGWWRGLSAERAAGHRAGVLAGRPAHPRALADAAAEARRRHRAPAHARSSTSRRATRRRCSASPTAPRLDRRPRRVRLGLPRRPRPGALPRPAPRRPGRHRRLPATSPRASRRRCPACSSPGSRRPATSGPSTASPRAARRRRPSRSPRCCAERNRRCDAPPPWSCCSCSG